MDNKSLYERYGLRGLFTDYIYRMYFEYKYSTQTDDIALILFERFYLTPWVHKYVHTRPKYRLREAQSRLSNNLVKLSTKLKNEDYNVKEDLHDILDVFRNMEGGELKKQLPKFLL